MEEAIEIFQNISLQPPMNSAIVLSIKRFKNSFWPNLDRSIGTLLGSPFHQPRRREAEDLDRKHLFHHGRDQNSPSQSLLAEYKRVKGRVGPRSLIPSRHDQIIFPAGWAWLDQKFSSGDGTEDMWDQQWNRFEWSSYAQWPEVRLAAFSWAFYKLLDSACGEDPEVEATKEKAVLRSKLQFLMDYSMQDVWDYAPKAMKDKYGFDR